MPCDSESASPEAMIEMGMTEEEIDLLEAQIKLLRNAIQQYAVSIGLTDRGVLRKLAEFEEQRAREIAHDRFHLRQSYESQQFLSSLKAVSSQHAKKGE